MIYIETKKELNTIVISSDSQIELGKTFIRFQEYYESPNPKFKNNIFTLGEYKYWYSKEYGADTYFTDWVGFNFPSQVLEPFRKGLFDPLTVYEKRLLNLLKYRDDDFYVVGANNSKILKHEISHALYYTNKNYQKNINNILTKNTKYLKKLKKFLLDKGYHPSVLHDEIQAYIISNDDFFVNNVSNNIVKSIHNLYKLYTKRNS
jgi:hypothetical protein